MHGQKAPAGEKTESSCQEKEEERGESRSFYFFHELLDPEEPQQKKDQDEDRRCLAPEFSLAEHIPNQVQAEVHYDEMIKKPDHYLF